MSRQLAHRGLFLLGLLAAGTVLSANVVRAQQNPSPEGATYAPGSFYPPYYGGGGGGWGGGGWGGGWGWNGVGSTAAGSYLTGLGNAIRAQGQFNLDTSAAAINMEEARRRNIENRKQWTNTYFEMRRINQAYKESQKGPPTTPDTWVRLAQQNAPHRLTPSQLDPVTGRITWPTLLTDRSFASDREVIEQMFAQRALAHGAIGNEAHNKIRTTIDDLQAKLRARIREFDTRQYLDARTFLTSLNFEASSPSTSVTTASRS